MDKNYWIFILLSMAVLMAYPVVLRWLVPSSAIEKPVSGVWEKSAEPPHVAAPAITSGSQSPRKEDGTFLEKPISPVITPYENFLYDVKFSSLGGTILELSYKGEKERSHVGNVRFFSGDVSQPGNFGMKLLHDPIDLKNTVFQMNRKTVEGGNEEFEFVFEKPSEYRITKTFFLSNDQPVIELRTTLVNLSPRIKTFPLELSYGLDYGFIPDTHQHSEVEAVVSQEKIKSKKADQVIKKGFFVSGASEWVGLVRKYFAVLVKPDWNIISSDSRADKETIWGSLVMDPVTVDPGAKAEKIFFIYAGPQRYEILKSFQMNFEGLLSRGFFGLFKIWLLISLKFFNQFTHNFGWSILLMTLILKGLFTPLTHMSYASMQKMQALQPKLKSIQERYKSDPAKLNRETMELYKRNRVNPMGGCLPMLAQIPVFIAFYQVLNETIEMKGAPFMFWIHDLAEPDRLFSFPFALPFFGDAFNLLPILMIGSMVWQQMLTPQTASTPEQAKMMQFMPIIFGLLFYSMPSGLVIYWFTNNMLTILHQTVIKKMGAVVLHHEDGE